MRGHMETKRTRYLFKADCGQLFLLCYGAATHVVEARGGESNVVAADPDQVRWGQAILRVRAS